MNGPQGTDQGASQLPVSSHLLWLDTPASKKHARDQFATERLNRRRVLHEVPSRHDSKTIASFVSSKARSGTSEFVPSGRGLSAYDEVTLGPARGRWLPLQNRNGLGSSYPGVRPGQSANNVR